jgi:hypothetical protein
MKALEKDRTRRYETANGLAGDIERHLNNEPVVAGPPTATYRLRKFVRRRRTEPVATFLGPIAAAAFVTHPPVRISIEGRGQGGVACRRSES